MCLISNETESKTAEKDIRVWKAVKVDARDRSVWSGPFRNNDKTFPFDRVVRESGKPVLRMTLSRRSCMYGWLMHDIGTVVGEGFFHAYTNCELCTLNTDIDFGGYSVPGSRIVVCGCTVPAGSRYFISKNGLAIASDAIVVESPGTLSFDHVDFES